MTLTKGKIVLPKTLRGGGYTAQFDNHAEIMKEAEFHLYPYCISMMLIMHLLYNDKYTKITRTKTRLLVVLIGFSAASVGRNATGRCSAKVRVLHQGGT